MIKVAIIDDEQLAVDNLSYILSDFKDIEVVGRFTDSTHLMNFLKETQVHLIFMDIEMPEVSGLELAEQVNSLYSEIEVVFATAYNQYAIKAFEVSAIDYILKPLSKARIEKTIENVRKRLTHKIDRSQEAPKVFIKCLGGYEIYINGVVTPFKVSKAKEVLAYLINSMGKSLGWMTIADDIWPDSYDDKKLMNNFHVASHSLRTFLNDNGISDIYDYSRNLYRIDPDKFECDFLQLHNVYNEYRKTGEILVPPATFDTGEYFEDLPYLWSYSMADKVEKMINELLHAYNRNKKN
ncbi:MAG: response regulator [Bacilli bacterium]